MWLLIAGATVTGICLLKMYHKWTINTCNSKADLTGKTVLITGANQGIIELVMSGHWGSCPKEFTTDGLDTLG